MQKLARPLTRKARAMHVEGPSHDPLASQSGESAGFHFDGHFLSFSSRAFLQRLCGCIDLPFVHQDVARGRLKRQAADWLQRLGWSWGPAHLPPFPALPPVSLDTDSLANNSGKHV